MSQRETIEQLLMDVSRQRTDAQAEASHASDRTVRLLGGLTPIDKVDPEQVRAAADTLCDALLKLRMLTEAARNLRGLLM
jgi:hypothetical protein